MKHFEFWRGRRLALACLVVVITSFSVGCASAADLLGSLGDVAIAATSDGHWRGSFFWFPNKVQVEVTVATGRITAIDILEHFHGQGEAAEAIVDTVIARQSLAVDAVSGATHSSITILKAIEVALQQGQP
ncbi:MAG: hypothetical protein A2087_10035 [Spirochaetes bacterium GWD1_61_31]|nr:MAG: hypothetical protein A2Y37_01855 [Spirochaetes bacterium GWB1_60_80]OHD35554.1 MAG: hypothetical protein A2004_06755 [Spirochaetes bacterium GWC1_61_12]OHD40619.1 MAG: hypothetical protein A2087_10035 [Spirochaetes bacterium GWD1_61_31]OHD43891.1 MAG: hypothetical protein A2Y35_12385 [Spirochaetes bacterium GWE1_60_18]OHD59762.1 MAG: hypothetical protein A2Y32_02240 [Spirochaetes bacterium GWF1_60_12]HAP43514.1 hypothetical protein [Spirochaetaceae bacterium]